MALSRSDLDGVVAGQDRSGSMPVSVLDLDAVGTGQFPYGCW